MNVGKVMRTKLILVKPDCPFIELLRKVSGPPPHQAYVVDDNYKLLGIVSAKDLLKEIMPSYMSADLARSFTDEADFLQRQIDKVKGVSAHDIMTRKLVYLESHHQLLEADALFAEQGFNTLPVLDKQGKILGEITRMDIISQLVNNSNSSHNKDLVDVSLI
jgi:CBS-domain-containing membrane protein